MRIVIGIGFRVAILILEQGWIQGWRDCGLGIPLLNGKREVGGQKWKQIM